MALLCLLSYAGAVEPAAGLEPATCCLRNSCSTAELSRLAEMVDPKGVEPSTCLLAKQMPLPRSSHGPFAKWWTRAESNRHLLNAIEAFYR